MSAFWAFIGHAHLMLQPVLRRGCVSRSMPPTITAPAGTLDPLFPMPRGRPDLPYPLRAFCSPKVARNETPVACPSFAELIVHADARRPVDNSDIEVGRPGSYSTIFPGPPPATR